MVSRLTKRNPCSFDVGGHDCVKRITTFLTYGDGAAQLRRNPGDIDPCAELLMKDPALLSQTQQLLNQESIESEAVVVRSTLRLKKREELPQALQALGFDSMDIDAVSNQMHKSAEQIRRENIQWDKDKGARR